MIFFKRFNIGHSPLMATATQLSNGTCMKPCAGAIEMNGDWAATVLGGLCLFK